MAAPWWYHEQMLNYCKSEDTRLLALTDSHCHLNSPHFSGRVPEILARAAAAGVETIIVPAWDHESSLTALTLAAQFPRLRPAIALHPWFIREDSNLDWLHPLLDDPRVCAIGEIGIDADITGADMAMQEEFYHRQLICAAERELPVLLHCRRGWDRLLRGLREIAVPAAIVHSYSGSLETLKQSLRLGCYISFSGMITRANSRNAQQAAAQVPVERLLIETDAPYMAMQDLPAEEVEPAHLLHVLTFLATLRNSEPAALARQLAVNLARIFP